MLKQSLSLWVPASPDPAPSVAPAWVPHTSSVRNDGWVFFSLDCMGRGLHVVPERQVEGKQRVACLSLLCTIWNALVRWISISQFLEGFCELLSTGEAAFLPTTWLPQAAAELGGKCVERACAGVGGADHGRTCCRPTSLQHFANPTSNLEFQEEQEPFFFFSGPR